MNAKNLFVLLSALIVQANCAGLLRTPKIYNALITTDENLTSSRAFPVIQPTIQETGIVSYPYSLGPYRYINPSPQILQYQPPPFVPFRQQQPQQQPLYTTGPVPLPPLDMKPFLIQNNPEQQLPPFNPIAPDGQQAQERPVEQPEIPLNEFGLPPSLVPLQSFPPSRNPINLQPYPYNNYPLIYDSHQNPFQQQHYLPPYGYYPTPSWISQIQPQNRPSVALPVQAQQSDGSNSRIPQEETAANSVIVEDPAQGSNQVSEQVPAAAVGVGKGASVSEQSGFQAIKNASSSQNSKVPDVPPPPVPSGAKTAAKEKKKLQKV